MSQTMRERKAFRVNKQRRYHTAEQSRKPGYLARKFSKIFKKMREQGVVQKVIRVGE